DKCTCVKTFKDPVVCALFSLRCSGCHSRHVGCGSVWKTGAQEEREILFFMLPSLLLSCSSARGGHANVTTDSSLTDGGALSNKGVSRMIAASRLCAFNDLDQARRQRRADVVLDLQLGEVVAAGAAALDDRDGAAPVA